MESFFLSHDVSSRDGAQVISHGVKHLYPLIYLHDTEYNTRL